MSRRLGSRLTEVLQRLEREAGGGPAGQPGPRLQGGEYELLVANRRQLREKAWRLVYEVYRAKGYAGSHPSQLRIILQDAHPEAVTYLAEDRVRQAAVATVTVVPDSPLGLPMDDNCGREMAALRASGRKLCEIVKLVQAEPGPGSRGADMKVMIALFRLAFLKCLMLEGATDMVVSVVPRHARFYQDFLLFEPLGAARNYKSVGETVGVPMRLDLTTAKERYRTRDASRPGRRRIFDLFVDEREADIVDWLRSAERPMTEAEVRSFFVERSDLFETAGAAARAYLQERYLAYDFEKRPAASVAAGSPTFNWVKLLETGGCHG